MVNNRIKKMLDEPVVCTDGGSHYIDESHKRHLSSQICQLFPQPLEGIRHPQCNHKDKQCSSMENQKGVDYGRCLLRNPWDCSYGFSPQPLDDKELREKGLLTPMERRKIGQFYIADPETMREAIAKAQQDKDFALLQLKIEEAKRERDLVWKRVIRESHISTHAMGEIMQALKGGE